MTRIAESIERMLAALRSVQHPLGAITFDAADMDLGARFIEMTGVPIPAELAELWNWWGGQMTPYSEHSGDRLPGFLSVVGLDRGWELRKQARSFEIEAGFEFVPGWFDSGNWLPIMWQQHAVVWGNLAEVHGDGLLPLEYRSNADNEFIASFSCVAELVDSMAHLVEEGCWMKSEFGWNVQDHVLGHEWVNL